MEHTKQNFRVPYKHKLRNFDENATKQFNIFQVQYIPLHVTILSPIALFGLSVNVASSMQAVIYTFLSLLLLTREHSAYMNLVCHPSLIATVITELSCSAVLEHYSVQYLKKNLKSKSL